MDNLTTHAQNISPSIYSWIPFYTEFANKLLLYKDDRHSLIEKIRTLYTNTGMKLPKLETDNQIEDIDPFTIFGLFNKGITHSNRKILMQELAILFDMSTPIPDSFDGVPVLDNRKSAFYYFKGYGRNENDIDHLWNIFIAALHFADTKDSKEEFVKAYDLVLLQKGVSWNITMGLYWIRPYSYINLDSRNRDFLLNPDHLLGDKVNEVAKAIKKVPDGKTYLWLCHLCQNLLKQGNYPYKDFPSLSNAAWLSTTQKTAPASSINHWLYAPGPNAEKWDELHEKGIIALGWGEIGDAKGLSKESIQQKIQAHFGDGSNAALAVWQFVNEMKPGDIVYAKQGRSTILGRGIVSSEYSYDPDRSDGYNHIRRINWENSGNWPVNKQLPMKTLTLLKNEPDIKELENMTKSRSFSDYDSELSVQYWWLTANPRIWSFASISVGNEQSYTWYNENGRKRRIFQNFMDARPGDKIIGYESTPTKQITTLCTVIQNENQILTFRKDESLSSPIDLSAIQDTPEFSHMEFLKNPLGSLFRLSETEYSDLLDLIRESNPISAKPDAAVYTKSDFLQDVFLSPSQLDELCELLCRKRNLILQGAPGVGKTYAARKLAYVILGKRDDRHIQSIQFHQNYSYEDFIMGYKPTENGFALKKGIFYTFCQQAANHPDEPFFFLIDEINRGNISKIFGELLMLIEKGYRNVPLRLAYDDIPFSVPDNVYLIGMMNTADRSLALIDYALRRRFSFFTMVPSFASKEFQKYTASLNNSHLNQLVQKIQELNQAISEDDSLGNGFLIGHSYFCGFGDSHPCTDEELVSIIRYDILPLLEEYWFDDQTKVQEWSKKLTGIFNDK